MHEDLKDLLSEKHSKVFYLLVTAYIRDTFFFNLILLKNIPKRYYLITLFIDLNVGKIMYTFATFLMLSNIGFKISICGVIYRYFLHKKYHTHTNFEVRIR